MTNTALQRLDRSVRLLGPFVVSIILVMLSALPIHVPGYGQIAVEVGLVTVFYWAIYRPDLFPVFAAFALGLWQDILVGSPIGMHALTLLLAIGRLYPSGPFFRERRSA